MRIYLRSLSLALLGGLTLLGVPPHVYALDAVDITAILEGLEAASREPPPLACAAETPPASTPDFDELGRQAKSFAAREKCSVLFADEPPNEIARHPDAHLLSRKENWHPFCSAFAVHRHRAVGDGSLKAALPAAENWLRGRVACEENSGQSPETPFAHIPSRKNLGLRTMTATERLALTDSFARMKKTLTGSCCGGHPACIRFLNTTTLRLCEPQANADLPEPCAAQAGFSITDIRSLTTWTERMHEVPEDAWGDAAAESFPRLPSTIELAPLAHESSGKWLNGTDAIAHELAHACSFARREGWIRESDEEAAREMITAFSADSKCELDSTGERVYRRLFAVSAASKGEIDCHLQNARKSPNSRYDSKPCPGACPRVQLEEAYAGSVAASLLSASEVVPGILPTFCFGKKDEDHPLGADALQCMMKTTETRKKIELGLGCLP